jgi:tRNA(fMet)-specific endonuclease VapC
VELIVHLDTNAYSDWRRFGLWHDHLSRADRIVVSTIVLGELVSGFRKGRLSQENRVALDAFLEEPQVELRSVNRPAAEFFGEFVDFLRKQGTPLPTNDIWIAAVVRETGGQLLTRDRHFENLPQVRMARMGDG